MAIYTIGFTKRSAADFFGTLKSAGIQRLLDVRLNNVSQLAGFSKRDDLAYFVREICGAEYVHDPTLAPTQALLDQYRKAKGGWDQYAAGFLTLLAERQVERAFDRSWFDRSTALLCSEPTADHCHRRLVVEYLERHLGPLDVHHL